MRVVKPNQLGVLSRPYEHDNKYSLCVAGLVLFPFSEPRYPMTESALWLLVGKELGEAVLDECMPKRHGELLLRANAYAPGGIPTPVVRAAVELDGKLLKELAVVGDRIWEDSVPSEPVPFLVKGITWENAFGGTEFKRNPLGKGHHAKNGSPLPNVEDRRRLITSTRQTPEPAGFMPYDIGWPQRQEKAGKYDEAWLEKSYPGLAENIDWTFFSVAPTDQKIEGFFRGNEELLLRNLHPQHAELRCKLPEVQVRCFMRRRGRSGQEIQSELEMRLDTVWLFPHASHGVLVYHGSAPIREDDATDVTSLFLACEDMGRPRSLEHYQRVFERWTSEEHGAVASLDDRPLMPELRGGMKRPPSPEDEMSDLVAYEYLTYKNMQNKGDREVAAARALLVEHGLDPDAHGPPPLPHFDLDAPIEEVLVRAEEMEKQVLEAKRQAEARAAKADEELRKTCQAAGIDFDEIQKEWRGPHKGGPPEMMAPRNVAELWAMAEEGRAAGMDVSEIEQYLGDPKFVQRLREQDRTEMEAYRFAAQDQAPAAARTDEESGRLRAELLEAHARGESLAGRDLTGADLAGIALPGANLEEALMECCNLAGANLSGANLLRAVLVRANLKGASLDGANLTAANLSGADCTETSFVDGSLAEAQLIGTRFASTILDGVNLERATLEEATLRGCSLRRVRAEGTLLDGMDLTAACLARAVLSDAVFLKCVLDGVDFSGADLGGATLVGCRATRAVFAGIRGNAFRVVEETTLLECDFRQADLEAACFRGTNLSRGDFSEAHAPMADFSECNMQDARLHHMKARQARFVRTDLTRAHMVGADLFEAQLSKAVLLGTNLSGANLYQADIALIRGDEDTQLTDAMTVRARTKPFYSDKVQDLD